MDGLLLREICRMTGASRRAIQGFEKKGLVSPIGKNKTGYLLYDLSAREKIREILLFQSRGFALREIVQFQNSRREEKKTMLIQKLKLLKREYRQCRQTIAVVEQMIDAL